MKIVSGKKVYDKWEEILNPDHTALLIIDMQNDFCSEGGLFHRYGKDLTQIQYGITHIAQLLEVSRELGILVVFVQQTTELQGRSDSPPWLRLKVRDGKDPNYTLIGAWGWEVIDRLKPGAGDLVVRKYRSDAYVQSMLDITLRSNRIESVLICGVVTEGCVESTVRGAIHHDYYAVLVEDCVGSPNKDLHEAAMRIIRSRYDVISLPEVLKLFSSMTENRNRRLDNEKDGVERD